MKTMFDASGLRGFIRRGEVHDWKNHLTDEMNRRIEKETYSRLKTVCPDLLEQWETLGILPGETGHSTTGE